MSDFDRYKLLMNFCMNPCVLLICRLVDFYNFISLQPKGVLAVTALVICQFGALSLRLKRPKIVHCVYRFLYLQLISNTYMSLAFLRVKDPF